MSSNSKKTFYNDSGLNRIESSNSLMWSEWSDNELNVEPWDFPKGGEFSDPQQVVMPSSLQPVEWKRFRELNYVTSPAVYETITGYPDLITNNVHLMRSEFIRAFVSTLINIQYCGRNGLEIENPTSNFSWNLADQCWQGWFSVYSLNKAGKGVNHRPVINPNGRYVVRIFYMGCWRRIIVDDKIPIDDRGRPLLPRTSNSNELWPMILAKAMLKIVALSSTKKREMVDCSLITCLTGWIGLSLNVSHLSPRDQWEFLTKYAKHFEWPNNENSSTSQSKFGIPEMSTKSRKSKIKIAKLEIPEDPQPTLLFLSLEDTKNVNDEGIPGVTPCWNHQIYVELSRDVPLDPTQVKPPLAKWKNHRWLDWAIRRGLADASEYFVPVRRLLIVSPLGRCVDDILQNDDFEDFDDERSSATSLLTSDKNNEKTKSAITTTEKIVKPEIPDISIWADFNKLSYYLRQVDLFYRQKFFKYKLEVSDSTKASAMNNGKKGKTDSSGKDVKKSGRKSFTVSLSEEKIYEYQDKIEQSRNEPLYLFVDSVDDKFFLINFSTTSSNLDGSSMKKYSSLIIERHNWFVKLRENESLIRIKTRGTKSMIFQLEPGRHLLQIFINTESSYRAILLSDTPFDIGNRSKMHDLMIVEAARINEISRNISNSLKKAFESFGTTSYSDDLKIYYRSYMPDSSVKFDKSARRVIKSIHTWFIDELIKLLDKRFSLVDLSFLRRAIRIFFLDPSIGIKQTTKSDNNEYEESWENNEEEEEEEEKNRINRHATIIQSFFRTIVTKRHREIHVSGHKEHNRVKDALLRVIEIFNYEKDEYAANSLLREIIKRDKCLKTVYPWANDLKHVIEFQEIRGRVTSVTTNQWIPIVRFVVNTEKSQCVFAAIDLFGNLTNYTVRAFANDDKREMLRVVNNVQPNNYRYRKNGYTIFAYGWYDTQKYKELEWSLHLTTIKGEPMFRWNEGELIPRKIDRSPLFVREISNVYVPNVRNCIFKIIAKVRSSTMMSLRLKTSYEKVLTKLRVVKKNNDNILLEIDGGESLIVPVVFLEFEDTNKPEIDYQESMSVRRRSSIRKSAGSLSHRSGKLSSREAEERKVIDKFTSYTIEAFVREDSWPLTEAEWNTVTEMKTRSEIGNDEKSRKSSISGRKNERSRNFSKSLQALGDLVKPYWTLQIVTDSENDLEIIRDTSREDKIAELRKIWTINEPERSERGRKLRQTFLDENTPIIAPSAIDLTNESSRSSNEDIEGTSVFSLEDEIFQSTKRTLVPPANLTNYLPPLDLTIYMVKEDEEEQRWVKSEYDEETLRNQRAMNFIDFEQSQSCFLVESAIFMEKIGENYRRTNGRYLENRDKRTRDMNEAYEIRQAYVESTKDTARSIKSKDSVKQKKGR